MNKLSESIKAEVDVYFRRNPRISERKLASLSGTSRYFIRNVREGLDFEKKIDLFKLNKLLQITSPNRVVEIINKIDPKFFQKSGIDADTVIKNLSAKRHLTIGSNDLYEVINDDVEAVIALLSANKEGVTEKTLQKIFGDRYKMSLERLVREGILFQHNKTYQMNIKVFSNLSIRFIKRYIPALLNFYRIGRINKGKNYIMMPTGTLNLEGMMEMQKAFEEFRKKIVSIKSDERFKGDIPFFTFGCFDSFLDI